MWITSFYSTCKLDSCCEGGSVDSTELKSSSPDHCMQGCLCCRTWAWSINWRSSGIVVPALQVRRVKCILWHVLSKTGTKLPNQRWIWNRLLLIINQKAREIALCLRAGKRMHDPLPSCWLSNRVENLTFSCRRHALALSLLGWPSSAAQVNQLVLYFFHTYVILQHAADCFMLCICYLK